MASTKIDEFTAHQFGPGINLLSLSEGEQIDWCVVISEIQNAGHSLDEIAERVKVPGSTLRGWKYGSSPRFEDALPLIELWSSIAGLPAEMLPRRNA